MRLLNAKRTEDSAEYSAVVARLSAITNRTKVELSPNPPEDLAPEQDSADQLVPPVPED